LKAVFVFYDVGPPVMTQGLARGTGARFASENVRVPVFGFYAGKDTRVMQSLAATIEAMTASGKPFHHVVYEGAEHAYMRVGSDPKDTNPANAAAVRASLELLDTQLRQVLE
jgi:dienelactone hydrolase